MLQTALCVSNTDWLGRAENSQTHINVYPIGLSDGPRAADAAGEPCEAEPAKWPQDRSEPMPRIHSRDGFSPVYDHQGEDNDWDEEGFSAVPAEITEHKRAEEGEGG